MANYTMNRQDLGDQGGDPAQGMSNGYGEFQFPYEDPAIVNPEELATFPKTVCTSNYHHHESHLVNKRTPVRDGRNITITDNHPDQHGFV